MEQHEKQYVYLFSNTVTTNILKIGKTNSHPEIRADQLSKQTGTIGKYICIWNMEVVDNLLAEAFLHFVFRPFHFHKEQYKMKKEEAIKIANKSIIEFNALLTKYQLTKESLDDIIEGFKILLEIEDSSKERNLLKEQINLFQEKKKSIENLEIKEKE